MHSYKLARILITLLFVFFTDSQKIKQNIHDLLKTLIINRSIIKCFYDKYSLNVMGESLREIKKEILPPLKNHNHNILDDSRDIPKDIFYKLQHISNQIRSIDCKKKVVRKGVLKKIKKFLTTQAPATVEESNSVDENWDGWTYENLQLMKQYYEEMQKELEEMRKLVD